MAMKKFINQPENLVSELLEGFILANSEIVKLAGDRLVARVQTKEDGKVGVVTMGGAGHEPALIGWVGKGLVDVCALGDIFAAPGAPRVLEAIKLADRGKGVVLLTFNHEGDVLSSNMVIQMAKRQGIKMQRVLVSDDVSAAPRSDPDNRRGLIGTLMAIKIAGAASEIGHSFEEVVELAERMANNVATLAVAVSPMKLKTADETADIMLNQLLKDLDVKSGERLIVFLNGSGATTQMELLIIFRKINLILEEKGIKVAAARVGEMLTTQEQGGFQMSIGRVDSELERLFKAPCNAPEFKTM